eukprot:265810_1
MIYQVFTTVVQIMSTIQLRKQIHMFVLLALSLLADQLDDNFDFTVGLTLGRTHYSEENGNIQNIDKGSIFFNSIFHNSTHHIIKRECRECSQLSHEIIYYKRLTFVETFDVYNAMIHWQSSHNELGTDFQLYSTLQDALNDNNPWLYCNYDDAPGAFRDCGPTVITEGQWTARNDGLPSRFSIYTPITLTPTTSPTDTPIATISPTNTPVPTISQDGNTLTININVMNDSLNITDVRNTVFEGITDFFNESKLIVDSDYQIIGDILTLNILIAHVGDYQLDLDKLKHETQKRLDDTYGDGNVIVESVMIDKTTQEPEINEIDRKNENSSLLTLIIIATVLFVLLLIIGFVFWKRVKKIKDSEQRMEIMEIIQPEPGQQIITDEVEMNELNENVDDKQNVINTVSIRPQDHPIVFETDMGYTHDPTQPENDPIVSETPMRPEDLDDLIVNETEY